MLCRVLLGVPEAAFYPGATYLLSRWYTRKVIVQSFLGGCSSLTLLQELTVRSAILVSTLMVSNAFGAVSASFVSILLHDRTASPVQVAGWWRFQTYGRRKGLFGMAMVRFDSAALESESNLYITRLFIIEVSIPPVKFSKLMCIF
jgi:hypothetical protein